MTQIGIAYRELYKLARGMDDEHWRSRPPAPMVERPKRAKPYRPLGVEKLEQVKLPASGTDEKALVIARRKVG